jgi:SnoaL-like domain
MMPASASLDHVAIAQVVQLYCRALDDGHYERLGAVFSDDAVLRYTLGDAEPVPVPFAGMVERLREFNRRFTHTQHLLGVPYIEIEGDTAHATTALRALHVWRHDGETKTWIVYGTYWDQLRRTPVGWRIHERLFRAFHREGRLE